MHTGTKEKQKEFLLYMFLNKLLNLVGLITDCMIINKAQINEVGGL